MTERRFNEAEVAEILERATVTQERREMPGARNGVTLADLHEIAREVGIPEHLIDEAARSIGSTPPVTRGVLGIPLRVEKIIDFGRRLDDAEWEHVVVTLREVFDARGAMRAEGSLRQWTNGNLQALLEPTPTGHRLRIRTYKGNALPFVGLGAAVFFAAVSAISTVVSTGGGDSGVMTLLGMAATGGATVIAATILRLPLWARERQRQMQEVEGRVV